MLRVERSGVQTFDLGFHLFRDRQTGSVVARAVDTITGGQFLVPYKSQRFRPQVKEKIFLREGV